MKLTVSDASDPAIREASPRAGVKPDVLREWIHNYERGLVPYAGTWRTPQEVDALQRRRMRRSRIVLVEVILILAALAVVNVALWQVVAGM